MTKYDDADFHEGAALEAGQPAENAFTHIGLYLGWLIRHDLADTAFIAGEDLAGVKAGSMTGSDLQSTFDSKLLSDMLTSEGAAFSDWYYEKYLDDYGTAFPDGGDYSVVDDALSRAVIDPILDRRYSEWLESGRPTAGMGNGGGEEALAQLRPRSITITMPDLTGIQLDPTRQAALEEFMAMMQSRGATVVEAPPKPHAAPDLESLIPAQLDLDVMSVTAAQWGDAKLRRALKQLNVATKKAFVVTAMRSAPSGAIAVSIYGVPDVSAERLEEEFESVIRVSGTKENGIRVEGTRRLHRVVGPDWVTAWWTSDGLVVSCSAPDESSLSDLISTFPV